MKVNQFERVAFSFYPSGIHSKQHLRPVLGLGAAGSGLNINEGTGGIRTAVEHTLELELLDLLGHPLQVAGDFFLGSGIALFNGQLQQPRGIFDALADLIEGQQYTFEARTLLAERLGALLVIPDLGVFEILQDLIQAVELVIEVKGTPLAHDCADEGLR